ncbi:MAG: hypothetical protein ACFCVC_03890 [Acidimicrobiia bacterium]
MNENRTLPPLLEIYLDDHWAVAGAGAALARRVARNNVSTVWASRLESLAVDIEADERVLTLTRGEMGLDGGRWKRRFAVSAEVVGRLKPNGRIISYSPLSRVLELEGLIAGVAAKRCLWVAISRALATGGATSSVDYAEMERRAVEQSRVLEALHHEVVAAAFADSRRGARSERQVDA